MHIIACYCFTETKNKLKNRKVKFNWLNKIRLQVTKYKKSSCIYLLFLSILFLNVELLSQEISTAAEIYNYEEGDIFHTRFYEEIDGYEWEKIYSKTVIDKYYSEDNDTVFYSFDVIQMERESYPPEWEWSQYTVTYHYTNLDSLINNGNIDTVYIDEELYNGREINYYEVDNEPNTNNKWRYVKGCGRAHRSYHGYGFGSYVTELLYYQKGDEEWGEPILILGQEEMDDHSGIVIYPNPTSDQLKIKTEGTKFEMAEMYTINGTHISSHVIQASSFSLNVSGLSSGTYIIRLINQENTYSEVFVKE